MERLIALDASGLCTCKSIMCDLGYVGMISVSTTLLVLPVGLNKQFPSAVMGSNVLGRPEQSCSVPWWRSRLHHGVPSLSLTLTLTHTHTHTHTEAGCLPDTIAPLTVLSPPAVTENPLHPCRLLVCSPSMSSHVLVFLFSQSAFVKWFV